MTQQIVNIINARDKIWIAIAPEGTRKTAQTIKSGFYRIAHGTQIPIIMFAFDYDHKVIRGLGVLHSSDHYEHDLKQILNTYKGKFSPKIAERLAIPLQKIWQKDIEK